VRIFKEVAKKRSEAPSAGTGGVLGVFSRPENLERWGAAFRTALYALGEGDLSGVVEAERGFHIIRVNKRNEISEKASYSGLAEALVKGLSF
jgi:peptidyl-prolyl cis-trans isomerase D